MKTSRCSWSFYWWSCICPLTYFLSVTHCPPTPFFWNLVLFFVSFLLFSNYPAIFTSPFSIGLLSCSPPTCFLFVCLALTTFFCVYPPLFSFHTIHKVFSVISSSLYSTFLFTFLSILSSLSLSFPSLLFWPRLSYVLSFVLSSLSFFLLNVFLSSHFCLHYYLVPSPAFRAGIFKHSMGAKK